MTNKKNKNRTRKEDAFQKGCVVDILKKWKK